MSLHLEARLRGDPPPPLAAAFSYELCAGILDKDKSIQETASEEARRDSAEGAGKQLRLLCKLHLTSCYAG